MRESVETLRTVGAQTVLAVALAHLTVQLALLGKQADAVKAEQESCAIARASRDQRTLAHVLDSAAFAARALGDLDHARALLEESTQLYAAAADRWGWAFATHVLAGLAIMAGRPAEAVGPLRQACRVFVAYREYYALASAFFALMCAEADLGDPIRAARLLGAAEVISERIGPNMNSWLYQPFRARGASVTRSDLGEADFFSEVAIGRTMSPDEVVADLH
jgi:hypothetical protein